MVQNSLSKTKTTTFMLPILGYTPKWYGDNLVNCYISAGNKNPNLVLVFDLNFDNDLKDILLKLDANESYLNSYVEVDELVYIRLNLSTNELV